MRAFDFRPPAGSVYVRHSVPLEKKTDGGIHVANNKPSSSVTASVVKVGDDVDDISVGDNILFDFSQATKVDGDIYCVDIESIYAVMPESGVISDIKLISK